MADLRGTEGTVEIVLTTVSGTWKMEVVVTSGWETVRAPFEEFSPAKAGITWTGDDLLHMRFLVRREGGQKVWLEIDQARFF